jgi:hypothetical protein
MADPLQSKREILKKTVRKYGQSEEDKERRGR